LNKYNKGEEKTYDVLNILDFNNVRKRMSAICRIDGEIVLFCKGADTIIKERLAASSLQLFESSEDHLNKFAEDALRTLCLAWKSISEEEYASWALEHHEASTSLENRHEKVSQVYEKIEKDLLFVGSTAIEDKLQDGVPECIAKLAKANIKIWVLTGDKQETAINIGYSCQLLTNDMDVYTIDAKSEADLVQQLKEKRKLIEDAIERARNELEKSNFHRSFMLNAPTTMNSSTNRILSSASYSSPSASQQQQMQKSNIADTSPSSILAGNSFALVINGQSLVYALMAKCEKEFLDLACMCKAVICCRVTPGQKKAVVDLVKTHKKAITLAVGDGANDVSMIKCN
jgi:phospholipid-translocating ATPase